MCLLNVLKTKAKKKTAPANEEKTGLTPGNKAGLFFGGLVAGKAKKEGETTIEIDSPDEEYQLPIFSVGNFTMNEELRRRQQDEQLRKKYNISALKEGSFV